MPGTSSPSSTAGSNVAPILVVQIPMATGPAPAGTPSSPVTNPNTQPGTGGGNATPAPAPTASSPTSPTTAPTAAPTSAPAPSGGGCGLPPGPGDGNNCPRTSPVFIADVEIAIDRTIQQRPDLFDGNRVRDWNQYYATVVSNLRAMGYCAIFDGEEVAVKNTNDFSEQYHVLLSSGTVRRGENIYRATCRPAWF